MSAFNNERFLPEAVESILDQSFREFEFIIINDGRVMTAWAAVTTLLATEAGHNGLERALLSGSACQPSPRAESGRRCESDEIV
jgi:hypothetical protein